MEPTMRAFGMTWKEQPGVGGMIHHPIISNNIQVRYATKNNRPYPHPLCTSVWTFREAPLSSKAATISISSEPPFLQ